MQSERKTWNQQQKELWRLLLKTDCFYEATKLLLSQHAALHTAAIASDVPWSFADAVMNDAGETQIRRIPQNYDHSIAWCFWHMARIEDVTMNVLVCGRSQILHQDNWLQHMNVTSQDTGNAMDESAIIHLSAGIDIDALRTYRLAVGHRTREIVSGLTIENLNQPVDHDRLHLLVEQGAVPAGSSLLSYWGKRTIAGLLLMPPTRHNFVHLNEAIRLNQRGKNL